MSDRVGLTLTEEEIQKVIGIFQRTVTYRDEIFSTKDGFRKCLEGHKLPRDIPFDDLWVQLERDGIIGPYPLNFGFEPYFLVKKIQR